MGKVLIDMNTDRLRALRKARHLTQDRLAEICGVARSTYTGYELGRIEPTTATLALLATELGTSIDYLQGESDMLERFDARYDTETMARVSRAMDVAAGGDNDIGTAMRATIESFEAFPPGHPRRMTFDGHQIDARMGDGMTGTIRGLLAMCEAHYGKGRR